MWGTDRDNNKIDTRVNKWANRKFTYLLICFFSILFSGCATLSDPEASQIHSDATIAHVTRNQNIGQSFISRRGNLNGVNLWLKPGSPSGELILEIRYSPEDKNPLVNQQLAVGEINSAGKTIVRFPPLSDQPEQEYILSLSSENGDVEVLGRDEDIYPYGNAFINSQPLEKDIAFELTYEYNLNSLLNDGIGIRSRLIMALPLGITLLMPGLLVLESTSIGTRYDLGEKIALALGLSLAVIPLLMMWTTVVGLSWNKNILRIFAIVGMIILFVQIARRVVKSKPRLSRVPRFSSEGNLFIILIFGIALIVRLIMIRDLSAPAWVDSVHHALITRSILEQGEFPASYAPHLPAEIGRYHPGFHGVLATFIWLSGLDIPEAMLLFGQVLNALTVFSVYSLTITLTDNRKAGLFAALITGLFTPMPAYYTSWGRYTQLSGLLVLPVGLKWIRTSLQNEDLRVSASLGILTIAGLSLLHYRVLLFFGFLVLSYWISHHIAQRENYELGWSKGLIRIMLIAIGSGLLASPWLIPTILELIIPKAPLFGQGQPSEFSNITWQYLKPAWGKQSMVLGGLGLLLGIFKRKAFVLTMILWVALMFTSANTGPLGIPLPPFVNNNSVEISLFLPISILGGYAFSQIMDVFTMTFSARWYRLIYRSFLLGGILLSFVAAQQLMPILNPVTFLFRQGDRTALSWIKDNIPTEETILINPAAWGYGLYMGNDGGFWIAPLTGRKTLPPPVLYGLGNRQYVEQVNQIIQSVQSNKRDSQTLWAILDSNKIKYVYLGARGGILSSEMLNQSPYFKKIYNQSGVWIFEVLPSGPP